MKKNADYYLYFDNLKKKLELFISKGLKSIPKQKRAIILARAIILSQADHIANQNFDFD